MQTRARWLVAAVVAAIGLVIGGVAAAGPGSSDWNSAGQNEQNTRSASTETKIKVGNVAQLGVKWTLTTGADVSATPAVDGKRVYVPDWAGNLYALDRSTGAVAWTASIPAASGVASDRARTTPVIAGNKLIVGTQGNTLGGSFFGWPGPPGLGGNLIAFDKNTGAKLWSTHLDPHFAAIITQSPQVSGNRVYVGVSSQEEAIAAFAPGYVCCSFRGSLLALDVNTGAIVWRTYTVPDTPAPSPTTPRGYSGNAVWGSTPAIDTKRGQLYIATGNNYSVPQSVLDCVALNEGNPVMIQACNSPDNHFDSIMALDLKTGAVKWSTYAIEFDAWTVGCIFGGQNCPDPSGPDFDFGQGPALFTVKSPGNGPPRDLVGAGQKSGKYWALDPDTGAVVWSTQAGPGGTAGGLQWGSAVDDKRVYTANSNSNFVPWPNLGDPTSGVWSGLDAATGQILWQTRPPHGGSTSGPASTANGVMFGCSLDPSGYMYALNGSTGQVLWEFASGGSCLGGAAISNGMVFWGSGYSNLGGAFGGPNNKLYAFQLP